MGRCRSLCEACRRISRAGDPVPQSIWAYLNTAIKFRAKMACLMGGDAKHRQFLKTLEDCERLLKNCVADELWISYAFKPEGKFVDQAESGSVEDVRREGPHEGVEFTLEELSSLDDLLVSETDEDSDAAE